jgi:F-type H+-transporting ATPase subunit alpha
MKSAIYSFEENLKRTKDKGVVEKIIDSLLYVSGFEKARVFEEIIFEEGSKGFIFSFDRDHCICLLTSQSVIKKGTKVSRSDRLVGINLGENLKGKIINPFGISIDKNTPITNCKDFRIFDTDVPTIKDRAIIDENLHTGVTVVDMMVPLGKGQRELIIGERGTGKNWFANSVLKSAASNGITCIYCGIGKKKAAVQGILGDFKSFEHSKNIISLITYANDPLGLSYLAPYSAMTIAEYFKDAGKDVLIVFDDLGTHAKVYREISLLCKRFPGRNSYPSDIFFTHSKLLERAGNFKSMGKNVSITCLPIVESVGGDISGYVQTNLMSMTDGHIFFDIDMYNQGVRPAINYFLSVTRVGRQTQSAIKYKINRELNNILSLYEKTKSFIHFGAEISEGVKLNLRLGERLLQFFDQTGDVLVPTNIQVLVFVLIWNQKWDLYSKDQIQNEVKRLIYLYENDTNFMKIVDELAAVSTDLNNYIENFARYEDKLKERIFPKGTKSK